jgi:anti-sigma B factor antagonist
LSPVPFQVDQESRDGVLIIAISGELDLDTAPEFEQRLGEAAGSDAPILINLSDCEFIDSTGLSLLVQAERRLTEEQRGFAICCPKADVKRLLELTGIDEAVGMFDTRDEAVAALQQRAAAS